ncbi:hypothetical protein [Dokdonella sp.]|uniref:hypothetical protein n=1 Tax=Dokdonella sp. TaxID=2291710 RepID=UPI0031BF69ED|nr:hypothetical protein [Dokdonella sp.]
MVTTEASRALVACIAVTLLLGVAGCTDKASPDNVDRRAVERWNYLIEHKAEQAYDYLTPGTRATQTREAYAAAMNNRPVQWKEAKFVDKECDADRCKVQVDVTYSVPMPAKGGSGVSSTRTQSETWLLVDGAWYLLPK